MLLESGAEPNARDKEEHTPLRRALDYEQPETAAILREHGATE
jgi:ankyrin repeat protein